MVGNTAALLLRMCSLAARKKEHRSVGLALSTGVILLSAGAGWLGGDSSVRDGRRVDQTVFEDPPTARAPLIDEGKLEEGEPVRRSARGTGVSSRSPARERLRAPRPLLPSRMFPQRRALSRGTSSSAHVTGADSTHGKLVRGPQLAESALEVRVQGWHSLMVLGLG